MLKGINVKINTVSDVTPALRAALKALRRRQVMVGVPAERTERRNGESVSNATLAYIHNTGSPSQNIPQREFMSSGVESRKDDVQRHMRQAGERALHNDNNGMERELHAAGSVARDGMRGKLHEGPFTTLKSETLAARKRRGRTGDRPLEDTGQLRNSLNYVIEDRKDDNANS